MLRTGAAVAALFALDDRLGAILRTTREPLVGAMRLAWWHEALTALDDRAPPAEPVLADLAAHVLPRGVTGGELAAMVAGWEVLLEADPLDDAAILAFARARGGGLFAAAARVLGASDAVEPAGTGWALVDLADNLSDAGARDQARALADAPLRAATRQHWSRGGRPLGALAHRARLHVASPARRALRLWWYRASGR